ncbi:MAG: FAD-linked oxidase C-terminal domain-containing protein [Pseudomonadota bacterium]|nr:FAD-linked oxidase C-terminal domain-containing protein [Pseudomonadota bacterium]
MSGHADRDVRGAVGKLRERFGERVETSPAVRERHGKDESFHPAAPPDAVIAARNAEEVQAIVSVCAEHRAPVIAYGAGTSLEGHIVALEGGICIDFSAMNRVLRVNAEDLDVVLQPGVTRRRLNEELRDTGLFFPVDPGADATLGGMAATRASGTNAVRYGTMRDSVLALQAVLADGSLVRIGGRARKSAAGYDLTRLLVGSEGTLGIITELTLRLHGRPEAISAAVCSFPAVDNAVNAVILTIQHDIPIARLELLDDEALRAINLFSGTDFAESPTLFMEFHGTPAAVEEQAVQVQEIAGEFGGGDFRWTNNKEERTGMWRARHDAAYAIKALRPDGRIWATDVCVPISRLAECIAETRRDLDATGILAPLVGHVGDGNFHLAMVVDHDDPEEVERAQALHERMVRRAIEMEGTCTGEHGIGYGKMEFLQAEQGAAVDAMRAVKHALDPRNILNPGKIVAW